MPCYDIYFWNKQAVEFEEKLLLMKCNNAKKDEKIKVGYFGIIFSIREWGRNVMPV